MSVLIVVLFIGLVSCHELQELFLLVSLMLLLLNLCIGVVHNVRSEDYVSD